MIYPQSKPRARVFDRAAYRLALEAKARAFRRAVWERDNGRCRACNRLVRKTMALVPERGEVHHRRGRNVAPQDRYNVKQAVLLCYRCHHDPSVIRLFWRA